ncbi:MAG: response regulator [Candidatus Omnitrophota bacterium]|nr:response regulator [Candidatus Omnitrophota bacterium]
MTKNKILVVDDNQDLIETLKVRLKAFGYIVVTALDGVECLEKCRLESPDLILLDILMPNMDGFKTLEELRNNVRTKNVPVIMLTAKSQLSDVTRATNFGIADYIVKPFDYRIMLEKIKRVLEK